MTECKQPLANLAHGITRKSYFLHSQRKRTSCCLMFSEVQAWPALAEVSFRR